LSLFSFRLFPSATLFSWTSLAYGLCSPHAQLLPFTSNRAALKKSALMKSRILWSSIAALSLVGISQDRVCLPLLGWSRPKINTALYIFLTSAFFIFSPTTPVSKELFSLPRPVYPILLQSSTGTIEMKREGDSQHRQRQRHTADRINNIFSASYRTSEIPESCRGRSGGQPSSNSGTRLKSLCLVGGSCSLERIFREFALVDCNLLCVPLAIRLPWVYGVSHIHRV